MFYTDGYIRIPFPYALMCADTDMYYWYYCIYIYIYVSIIQCYDYTLCFLLCNSNRYCIILLYYNNNCTTISLCSDAGGGELPGAEQQHQGGEGKH